METDAQGKFVLDHSDASSLQVIVNLLRQKPVSQMISQAKKTRRWRFSACPISKWTVVRKIQ